MNQQGEGGFAGLTDLAAERYGGLTLSASDEFFAEKGNLLKPGRGVFIEDKYTDRGKWMDGWETRRKRSAGYDWCIIRLGFSGRIRGVDVDTNHFLGNHPPFASLDACHVGADETLEAVQWVEICPRSALNPGTQNFLVATGAGDRTWTHVRLNIYPDGGVARLRVYGEVVPESAQPRSDGLVDLVAMGCGGRALACSDMFFSHMQNLIQPGDSRFMGDGWETKRRRGPGHDWIILKLGRVGSIAELELFTTHYKGNYPDLFSVEGILQPDAAIDILNAHQFDWQTVLDPQKLGPDARFVYREQLKLRSPLSHLRINMFPDGGIARLRCWGSFS